MAATAASRAVLRPASEMVMAVADVTFTAKYVWGYFTMPIVFIWSRIQSMPAPSTCTMPGAGAGAAEADGGPAAIASRAMAAVAHLVRWFISFSRCEADRRSRRAG